jgi:protein-S-isoprenylcysteine O-methyltransferase Ste14
MIADHYHLIIYIWIAFAVLMFPVLLKVTAPYGRHARKGWGPTIPNRLGWMFMELPSLALFVVFFWYGPNPQNYVSIVFFLLYVAHYTHRSVVFPFRTHTSNKRMPLIIAVLAILFNLVNGSLNGLFFGTISSGYDFAWLADIRFVAGGLLFAAGAYINIRSDNTLLALRKNSANGYAIPEGGLFRYISCPNFFGEILEWAGFAVMTWSPAALAFAVWTLVNLVPRALDHHRWYRERFEQYPASRKALIPGIL